MGSTGTPTTSFSDVATHSTPLSDNDRQLLLNGIDHPNKYFQSFNAFTINTALRSIADKEGSEEENLYNALLGLGKSSEDALKTMTTISMMDKGMQPLNDSISVVRYADNSYFSSLMRAVDATNTSISDVNAVKDALVGATIYESGFMSTTYDTTGALASFRLRPIRLDLTVPVGTKALFSPTGQEAELVLNRKSGYTITDVVQETTDDGKVLVFKGYVVR